MSWWNRAKTTGDRWWKGGRHAAENFVHHGLDKAREAGRFAARQVTSLQKAVGLPEHLMRRSARSVADKQPVRESHAAWQQEYLREAATRVPGLLPAEPFPRHPEPPEPGPSWPRNPNRSGPDREAGT